MADQDYMSQDISSWEQLSYPPGAASAQPVAFVTRNVPYVDSANPLQTMTLYLPIFGHNHKTLGALRDGDPDAVWLVYIHGGAWRDPTITAASFDNAATHILSPSGRSVSKVAGIASLDYSLSPHPDHPFSDSNASDRRARSAMHPQHLLDVLAAISNLQRNLRFADRFLLAGHSCGATLALQAGAMSAMHDRLVRPAVPPHIDPPRAIAGLSGLYDLPALVDRPGAGFEQHKELYAAFVAGAFGDDGRVRAEASPAVARLDDGSSWASTWPGRMLVLCQSDEDSVVPPGQTQALVDSLGCRMPPAGELTPEQAFFGKALLLEPATRDHDSLWEDGEELAGILGKAIARIGCTP